MIHTIVVASDLTDGSVPAVRTACELAERYGAKLIAVHATEPTPEPPRWHVPFVEREHTAAGMDTTFQQAARKILEDLLREVAGADAGHAEVRVASGQPAAVITDVARDSNADLVVVGTHGRRGFRHMVIGSVAETVVRMAPCDVLTVKSGGVQRLEADAR